MKSSPSLLRYSSFLIFIGLIVVSLSFQGCNHKMDEVYFKEVEPPAESVQFELTLDTEGDTLFVTEKTSFRIKLEVDVLKMYEMNIFVGEKLLKHDLNNPTNFTVEPLNYETGYYQLSAYYITSSGSGSIADILEAEGYIFERHWVLVIENRPAEQPTSVISINADKYLSIKWNKTDHLGFKRYNVIVIDDASRREFFIYDRNDTSFVDSCYKYGHVDATVRSEFTNADAGYAEFKYLNTPLPEVEFYEPSLDSLTLFWNIAAGNPMFILQHGGAYLLHHSYDTSITIAIPPLERDANFYLTIETDPYENCPYYNSFFYKQFTYKRGIYFSSSNPTYAFNKIDQIIYSSYRNGRNVIKANDIQTLNSVNYLSLNNDYIEGGLSTQANSSKLALLGEQGIKLFENNQLENPVFIENVYNQLSVDHFYYTMNNKIALVQDGTYKLIDTENPNNVLEMAIGTNGNTEANPWVGTHKDGLFATFILDNGLKHYRIQNNSFTLIHESTNVYNSVLYSENDPVRLYLSSSNSSVMEVREPGTYALINQITLPEPLTIRNIDPETGYMLLSNPNFIYVIKPENGEVLLKTNTANFRINLYGSKLFMKSGRYYDIKSFLP